jgi:hypothetical protein
MYSGFDAFCTAWYNSLLSLQAAILVSWAPHMRINWWAENLNCKMHCLQFAHKLVCMCVAQESVMVACRENDEYRL